MSRRLKDVRMRTTPAAVLAFPFVLVLTICSLPVIVVALGFAHSDRFEEWMERTPLYVWLDFIQARRA